MEHFTFSDPAIKARMDKAVFLQVDVTANTMDDQALLKRFHLFGPPGIIFFDAKGQEQKVRVIGFQKPERFGQSLDAAGL
jgi:thiol:disulfide interchange protein DsbD